MSKILYPIFNLPNEHDAENEPIPTWIKWWLLNNYNKKHSWILSEIITGNPLTLSNSVETKFYLPPLPRGNSKQDGEPSPTNEVPIQNVTGDAEVLVQNKNLALNDDPENPDANYKSSGGGSTIVQYNSTEDGYFTINHRRRSFGILKPGSYAFSVTAKARSEGSAAFTILTSVKGYNDNLIVKSSLTNNYTRFTYAFTISEDKEFYLTFYDTLYWKDIQLEQGTTASTYTPHKEQTLPLTLGNIELCKIGTYQDYFYKENGKWYLYKAIGKAILDGTINDNVTNIGNYGTKANVYALEIILLNIVSGNSSLGALSNKYHVLGDGKWSKFYSTAPDVNVGDMAKDSPGTGIYIGIPKEYNTTELGKAYLAENPAVLYYQLATPTSTEITDTTLISQLDAISNAISYNEQTNISGTSSEAEPLFEVQYYMKNESEGE